MWVCDVETTIFAKGNPYSLKNKLVCVGLLNVETNESFVFYEEDFPACQELLSKIPYFVGFNFKFDLAWLRRYFKLNPDIKIWDCQLWDFLDSGQRWKYPDLDTSCAKKSLGRKLDVVEEEYWNKGIDTDQVPRDVLSEYLDMDLQLTSKLFRWQHMRQRPWKTMFLLQCEDILCLQDMEKNGIKLDIEEVEKRREDGTKRLEEINKELSEGRTLPPNFNFDSGDHLSCYLFGGNIVVEDRVPVGVYKTGQKVGQTRFKIVEYKYELPRLIKPLDRYALKKEGYWATSDEHLSSVKPNKAAKRVLDLLSERAEITKLVSTYYKGFVEIINEKGWEPDIIHGQFNQCVAATSRLSASAPNQQNIPPKMKETLVSRYS